MNQKLINFTENKKNINKIVDEIINIYFPKLKKENIEYKFDINKDGEIKEKTSNTVFQFDTEENTQLDTFKKMLLNDDNDISKSEAEEINQIITKFLTKISNHINKNHNNEIKNIIRKYIIPSASEKLIPLSDIQIKTIDIIDYSYLPINAKKLLRFGKEENISPEENKEIIKLLYKKIEDNPEKDIKEIFESEKMVNPLLEKINNVQLGNQYLYEINISLFVDYSFNKKEALKEIKKNKKNIESD